MGIIAHFCVLDHLLTRAMAWEHARTGYVPATMALRVKVVTLNVVEEPRTRARGTGCVSLMERAHANMGFVWTRAVRSAQGRLKMCALGMACAMNSENVSADWDTALPTAVSLAQELLQRIWMGTQSVPACAVGMVNVLPWQRVNARTTGALAQTLMIRRD